MSEKVNRDIENIKSFLEEKFIDVQTNSFLDQIELTTDLRSTKEFHIIAEKRFKHYEDLFKNLGITLPQILKGFHYSERKIINEIYDKYEKSKSPKGMRLVNRCYHYLKYTETFDPNITIQNTFSWVGKSEKEIESEVSRLYAGLRGLNKKRLFLISANTSEKDFIQLMTGSSVDEKVQWMEAKNLFIYFIDEVASTFLNLPASVEEKFSDDTSKRKALMDWLNPKILDCFQDRRGNDFKVKHITSLRSKLDLSKLKHKDVIDEIISKTRAV